MRSRPRFGSKPGIAASTRATDLHGPIHIDSVQTYRNLEDIVSRADSVSASCGRIYSNFISIKYSAVYSGVNSTIIIGCIIKKSPIK